MILKEYSVGDSIPAGARYICHVIPRPPKENGFMSNPPPDIQAIRFFFLIPDIHGKKS